MDRNDIRKQWDKVSRNYSDSRDADGPETELLESLVDSFSEDPKILDVGCGDGERTLRNLPNDSLGIDISREGLKIADDKVNRGLIQADMISLPFKNDSFDGVTAYFSVFHVKKERHQDVFDEFSRVLKPNGKVLMTLSGGKYETVRNGWMGGRMLFSSPGRNETLNMLERSGFSDYDCSVSNDPLGGSTEFVIAQK